MKILFFSSVTVFIFSCNTIKQADTIVHNGNIYTVNKKFDKVQAFAISNGKLIALGSDNRILKKYSAAETIDAKGQAVYPGFIDAHAHFLQYGQSLYQVDLFGLNSWEEIIEKVKRFASVHPAETWIRGRGWDQNKWPGKAFPTNEKLNELFADKPVLLERVDGHAAIANQKALDLSGIRPGQTIPGGEIETSNGKLTGVLIDNAVNLIDAKLPKASVNDYTKWLIAAQNNCFAFGLTTIADCGLMYTDVEIIDVLQKEGKLKMRLYVLLRDEIANYARYLKQGPYKTDKLFVKGFKSYADGALGSRGACLLQPYSDRPGWYGFLLKDIKYYDSLARILINTGFQMCTHAIGDSANRAILNIYNSILPSKNDKRWRIEHAQVIDRNDFNLFGKSGIVPSVQPTHGTSDMYWAADRLDSQRVKGAYAYKQLLQQNGWLPLGTDFPVEDISPFKTFSAAVTRKDATGFPANGFQMENALTREEAIRGMTIWAAKACFLDAEAGSLETGKKADFIILDKDLMQVADTDILDTKVLMTYVGGKKVWPF